MASNRESILAALLARVGAIQIAAGFTSDAGLAVTLGESPLLGPDDPDVAIAILVNDDDPKYQGMQIMIRLPVSIQALANPNLADPWLAVEALLGDIKRAVELEDRTLGGLVKRQIERGPTRTVLREPGSTVVGAQVTYICPYTECWGNP
jgi:hypothetical protein